MVIDSNARRSSRGHRGWRYAVAVVSVIAVAASIYLGIVLRESAPNYYQPARRALVAAQARLAESLNHETALMEQLHLVHRELDATITELAKAERLDPADKQEIETMRVRLQTMEDAKQLARMSPEELHETYLGLSAQIDALIRKLEHSN